MVEIRDAVCYEQLARHARKLATGHKDPVFARRLRETAIKHERKAIQLRREEDKLKSSNQVRSKSLFSIWKW